MEQVIKKRLQQVMDASVAKGETPGCLLMVIKDGEEQVYLESGYADIEAKKPVSRDNIFRLYSMSKPITATAMMILVERGIVDLADPVSKYLPGFRNPVVCTADGKIEKAEREILLEDIMNMTSGLTYSGTDETGRQTDALFQEVIHGLKEENGGTISTVEFANRLGNPWNIASPGVSYKLCPSCRATHFGMEAALQYRERYTVDPELISEIECHVPNHMESVLTYHAPQKGLEGKFSLEYVLARTLLSGTPGINDFTDERVNQPEIKELIKKIKWVSFEPEAGSFGIPEYIVKMKDGTEFCTKVEFPKGEPENPVTDDVLGGKYQDCAGVVFEGETRDQIRDLVMKLEQMEHISQLTRLLGNFE